jgi:glycosyltransferase involved in cell wall biosynthesis
MKNKQLRISLLVPVRNGMPHLPATIESILLNAPNDSEIIIRNNGSADGTATYLSSLSDPRIRIFTTNVPESASENWTEVSRLARGRFIKIVCADDLVHEGAIDRQISALEAAPSAVMVASRRNVIDNSGKMVLRGYGLGGMKGFVTGNQAIRRSLSAGTNVFGEPVSVLFRAETLQDSLPFSGEWAYLTDLEMYRKVLQHGDFIALKSIDSSFRLSSNSWSQSLVGSQKEEFLRWVEVCKESDEYKLGTFRILQIRATVSIKTWLRRELNRITSLRLKFRN